MMYEAFFRLRDRPFDLSPDPRFLVLTETHREAISNLHYAFASRTGVTLLVGDAGAGKTLVIRAAIQSQSGRTHCILLSNPTLTRQEFVEMIAQHFGLSAHARTSKAAMLLELEALMAERLRRGETTVLVLDEAQSMPVDLLEDIRLLANIETDETKLLSVVLAGQPELTDRLNGRSLRQLKQRVALRCDIRPLSPQETEAYVAGRIRAAGGEEPLFTADAIAAMHRASRGLPRTINVIADNSLLGAFAAGRPTVDLDIVQGVCRDFDLDPGAAVANNFFRGIVTARQTEPELPIAREKVATAPAGSHSVQFGTAKSHSGRRGRGRVLGSLAMGLLGLAAAVWMDIADQSAGRVGRAPEVRETLSAGAPAEVPTGRQLTVAPTASDRPSTTSPDPAGRADDSSVPTSRAVRARMPALPSRASGAAKTTVASARSRTVAPRVTPPPAPETLSRNLPGAASAPASSVAATPAPAPTVGARAPLVTSPEPRVGPPQGAVSPPLPATSPGSASTASPPVSAPGSALPVGTAGPAPGSESATPTAAAAPIQTVLEQYRRAFGTLSAAGVQSFWPSVNTRSLQRAFDQIDSQRIVFDSCVSAAVTASRVQVSCGGTATFVPKVGNKSPRTEPRRWTFHLSRVNTAWTIERVESR